MVNFMRCFSEYKEKITIWTRLNKDNIYEHNHISVGHDNILMPIAINNYQKNCWKNAVWKSEKAYLINHKVIKGDI